MSDTLFMDAAKGAGRNPVDFAALERAAVATTDKALVADVAFWINDIHGFNRVSRRLLSLSDKMRT